MPSGAVRTAHELDANLYGVDGVHFFVSNSKNEKDGQEDHAKGGRNGVLYEKFWKARHAADVYGKMG